MNVSSCCWSTFHTNEWVFSRNEQQKEHFYVFISRIILFNNKSPQATNCFSIITLMMIRGFEQIKLKRDIFLKYFGALRCRSRATLIDNKLVFL